MKKNVVLSIVGVLLILGIGISFAYYVSQVLISGDGSDVSVTPGDMIKVTYDAGSGTLNTEGMVPGDIASKEFSVTVTPTEKEKEATYSIILNITENTFVKCDDSNYNEITNACQIDAEELVYRLKDNDNQIIAEGSLMGVTGEIKLTTETKTVDVQTTYNYTLEIEFIDTGYDQNHNQNKILNGSVEVEFSNKTLRDTILADNPTIDDSRSGAITGPLTENTTGTLFTAEDDDGTSYFYAGDVDNNWVSFAGYYWRIIRINGDGSVRMIYSGDSESGPVETGEATQIGTSAFNEQYNDNAYVGYMYGTLGSDTYEEAHANINDSSIKTVLDNWYQQNLLSYSSYISAEQGFCNDRQIYTGASWDGYGTLGYGPYATTYIPTSRFMQWSNGSNSWGTSQTPTLNCIQSNDYFTVNTSSRGNHALAYPIGLITVDEIVLAGSFGGTVNSSYYLYTNQTYWTMSPLLFTGAGAGVFAVASNGSLGHDFAYNIYGVRPVINLDKNVTISSGDGTMNNPYRIEVA